MERRYSTVHDADSYHVEKHALATTLNRLFIFHRKNVSKYLWWLFTFLCFLSLLLSLPLPLFLCACERLMLYEWVNFSDGWIEQEIFVSSADVHCIRFAILRRAYYNISSSEAISINTKDTYFGNSKLLEKSSKRKISFIIIWSAGISVKRFRHCLRLLR